MSAMDRTQRAASDGWIKRWAALDLAFLAGLVVYWAALVTPLVLEDRHPYDGFRDIASARHLLLGGAWADPAYAGETVWHPPLGPLIVAMLSGLLALAPETIYLWSQLLVNWLIPAGLYLVVRLAWRPLVGVAAVMTFALAMPWWQEYLPMHIASWQALIGAWAALLIYAQAERRGSILFAAACGVWLGLGCLFHPLVPGILMLTFALAAGWGALRGRESGGAGTALLRGVAVVGLAAVIGVPLVYLYQHGPILNAFPREYFDHKLLTPRYAGLGGNPWLWGVGLLGLATAVRNTRRLAERLLLCALIVTALGQGVGYLRWFLPPELHAQVPIVLPHQFQMHFQLLWAVCIGLGLVRLLGWLPARVDSFGRGLAYAACLAVTCGYGLARAPYNYRSMKSLDEYYPHYLREAAGWISANTATDDVFMLNMEMAYLWLSPSTARKVWLLPIGHSNPRVDWFKRLDTADALTGAESGAAFHALAADRGIDYFVCILHRDPDTNAIAFDAMRDWIPVFCLKEPRAVQDSRYFEVVYDDPRGVSIVRVVRAPATRPDPDGTSSSEAR